MMATPKQVRRRGRLSLVLGSVFAAVAFAAVAYGDTLEVEDLTTNGPAWVTRGQVASAQVWLQETGSGGNPGCDISASATATVALASSNTAVATIDAPGSVTLEGCGTTNKKTNGYRVPTSAALGSQATISGSVTSKPASANINVGPAASFGVTVVPRAPSLTTAGKTQNSLTVNWSLSADDSDITDYELERASSQSGPWTIIAHPAKGASSYADTGLSADTQYCYRIAARFQSGGVGTVYSIVDIDCYRTLSANTPPVLSLPSNMTVEGNTTAGAFVTYTAGASDAQDGALTPSCSPSSGSFFALGGPHTVACSVTDTGGLSANGSFTVTVVDTTAPTITASTVPANMTVEGNTTGGANVTYTKPSATDTVDASPTVTCSPASGSLFALGGPHTVSCTAKDASNNTSAASTFTVTVVDTTAPTITPASVPADIVRYTMTAPLAVTWTNPTATDIVDSSPTVVCTPAPGSSFNQGTTQVSCVASDDSLNTSAPVTFNVTVNVLSVVFHAPIDGPSVMNNGKQGRVIPVKAEVFLNGVEVRETGLISILVNGLSSCPSGSEDALETYASAGEQANGNQFSWDPSGDRWTYPLDTSAQGMAAPKCYRANVYYGGTAGAGGKVTNGHLAGYFLIKLSK